jgi:hypothetical protein
LRVEFADHMRGIEAEALARAIRTVAKAIPDFAFGILLATEQDGRDSVESSPPTRPAPLRAR